MGVLRGDTDGEREGGTATRNDNTSPRNRLNEGGGGGGGRGGNTGM